MDYRERLLTLLSFDLRGWRVNEKDCCWGKNDVAEVLMTKFEASVMF